MPCNTITVQAVGGLENALPDLVKAAFGAVFWSVREYAEGRLQAGNGAVGATWVRGRGLEVSARSQDGADKAKSNILTAYSKAAVSWAAKRAGWRVAPVVGSVNRLVVQRG
jgi:hypothetical protein